MKLWALGLLQRKTGDDVSAIYRSLQVKNESKNFVTSNYLSRFISIQSDVENCQQNDALAL